MHHESILEKNLESAEGRLGALVSRFLMEQEALITAQRKELKSWLKNEKKVVGRKRSSSSMVTTTTVSPKKCKNAKNIAQASSSSSSSAVTVVPVASVPMVSAMAIPETITATSNNSQNLDPSFLLGYLLFSKEWRAENKANSKNRGKVTTGVTAAWEKLTVPEKAVYVQQAQESSITHTQSQSSSR